MLSADSVNLDDNALQNQPYPIKFLNSLKASGLLLSKLALKAGSSYAPLELGATFFFFFFLKSTIYSAVLVRQSVGHVRYRPINLHYNTYIITGGEGTHCCPSNGSRVFAYPCCI